LRVQGSGFGVEGSEMRVEGAGLRNFRLEGRVEGLWFRVLG